MKCVFNDWGCCNGISSACHQSHLDLSTSVLVLKFENIRYVVFGRLDWRRSRSGSYGCQYSCSELTDVSKLNIYVQKGNFFP